MHGKHRTLSATLGAALVLLGGCRAFETTSRFQLVADEPPRLGLFAQIRSGVFLADDQRHLVISEATDTDGWRELASVDVSERNVDFRDYALCFDPERSKAWVIDTHLQRPVLSVDLVTGEAWTDADDQPFWALPSEGCLKPAEDDAPPAN